MVFRATVHPDDRAQDVELSLRLAELAPSKAEMAAIERAASRWGCTDPTPSDVLDSFYKGRVRAGVWSVLSALATRSA